MQELISNSTLPTSLHNRTANTSLVNKDAYFITHLSLSKADAHMLHQKYYKEYGLAIEGLVRHHKVDALEYNREVDDALPLDEIITPDPTLRTLLEDIDRTKVKLWLFTNAYITHGKRVVKLLGVDDLFEGITYCDYGQETMICKPHAEMYEKAEAEAGAGSVENCYFVGPYYPPKSSPSISPVSVPLSLPLSLRLSFLFPLSPSSSLSSPFPSSPSFSPTTRIVPISDQQKTIPTSTATTPRPAAGRPSIYLSPTTLNRPHQRQNTRSGACRNYDVSSRSFSKQIKTKII